jgi:ATP-binding cassette, subfamily B, bacterial
MIKEIYINFLKKHWKYYTLFVFTFISTPLRQIGIPHYYGKIIEQLNKNNIKEGSKLLVILLAIWIVIQLINLLQEWTHMNIWPRFAAYTEETLLARIIDRYNTHFQELKVGEILTKLIKLPWILDEMQDYVQDFLMNNMIIMISNLGYLCYHSYYLGGVYILGILIFLFFGYRFVNNCKSYKIKAELQYDHCHGIIEDILSNLISVYTSKEQENEKEKVHKENNETINRELDRLKCNLKFKAIFCIINVIIFIGLNFTTLYLFKHKKINLGALTAIFILNYNILTSLLMYYRNARNVVAIQGNLKYIKSFLNCLPDYNAQSKNTIHNAEYGIDIRFQDIEYTIPNSTTLLYDKLNLEIPSNQSLVIMGSIGSGKSTFAKLLVGLQIPDSGDIFINNVNTKNINVNNIRENIIYIPQAPSLFDRTLWENISYGFKDNSLTRDKVYETLDVMGMNELKDIFEERMDKSVGKKGSHLSGGQRQVVWILRALLGKSKVIILDEPTSALDNASKQQVKRMINYLTRNRTLIVITHDQELLENMDRIIIFDKGKIISDKDLTHSTGQLFSNET